MDYNSNGKPAQLSLERVCSFEPAVQLKALSSSLSSPVRVFPFCRPSVCHPGYCSAAEVFHLSAGRQPSEDPLVDACRPLSSGQRRPSRASPRSPQPVIFALNRTSCFPSSSCIYQARMGGRAETRRPYSSKNGAKNTEFRIPLSGLNKPKQ